MECTGFIGLDLSALYINLHQGSCLIHVDTEGYPQINYWQQYSVVAFRHLSLC